MRLQDWYSVSDGAGCTSYSRTVVHCTSIYRVAGGRGEVRGRRRARCWGISMKGGVGWSRMSRRRRGVGDTSGYDAIM